MSEITGATADVYTALGGLLRVRLKKSKSPVLKALAQRLDVVDANAKSLKDVISPQGFVGIDGKKRTIPGISFSNNSALFDAIKRQNEISDELLKRQIDYFAKKREERKATEDRILNMRSSMIEVYNKNYEMIKKNHKARAEAMDAYLEHAFGINKKKTETSEYSNSQRATDSEIFGSHSGGVDYNTYTVDKDLTLTAPAIISYDWDEDATQKKIGTVKLEDYIYDYTLPTDNDIKYAVRLIGKGKTLISTPEKPVDPGNRVPSPTGSLTYISGATNAEETINGSQVTELTADEFKTLKYKQDFTGKKEAIIVEGKIQDVQVHDYLAVTAVNTQTKKRGYINKISLTKGKISKMESNDKQDLVYKLRMKVPYDAYFTRVTMKFEGNFYSDGNDTSKEVKTSNGQTRTIQVSDGTALNMIQEGTMSVFVREFGYTQKLEVDIEKSLDNKLVFTKDNSKMLNDGLEVFVTINQAHRKDVQLHSVSFGDTQYRGY